MAKSSRRRNPKLAAEIKTEGGVPEESKEDDGIEDLQLTQALKQIREEQRDQVSFYLQ